MSDTNIYSTGVIPDVQKQVRDRLASFADFNGVALIMQYEGSIESRISEALSVMTEGCRPGIAVLIATPYLDESPRSRNSPGLLIDPLAVSLAVVEDTIFNQAETGSGRRCIEWAILCVQALKGWTPTGCSKPLTGLGKTITLAPSQGSRVQNNVSLQTSVGLPLLRHQGEYGFIS